MANISGDVEVSFWLEADGKVVSSGYDTIYIGEYDEKTKTARLFISEELAPGQHTLFIELKHLDYTVSSHRTMEVAAGTVVEESVVVGLSWRNPLKLVLVIMFAGAVVFITTKVYCNKKKISRLLKHKWFKLRN